MTTSIITGLGSYIPKIVRENEDFTNHQFLNSDGTPFSAENEVIIKKFKSITGIEERRYADKHFCASDLGYFASEKAIENAGIDKEQIDYIIFAHNFGDVKEVGGQADILPSLATRVKHLLRIKNPNCVAYDILFGCPGWVEGVIQAHAFIKAGIAKKVLVIGGETLSRVVDHHDRDSMIYSDGAGACIVEAKEGVDEAGIISHASQTFAKDEAFHLFFGESFNTELDHNKRYIKMYGRKIYEFALNNVPNAMKHALDKSGIDISEVKKILIHQANEKMDEAIIKRFYRLYKMQAPEGIMPMSIHKLGNSSVATVPTLFDLIVDNKLKDHSIEKGDVVILASVGAGMNINAIVYRY